MHIAKIILAAGFISSMAFAESAFHVGAKISGNYNMIWNVDNNITTTDIINNLGIPSEAIEEELDGNDASIKDADKLSGFGSTFGLVFRYQATESFAIQPELVLSYRGRSVELTVKATESEYNYYTGLRETNTVSQKLPEIEINQWFLDIPILFRFQTGMGLFFNLGPVISFNLDTELKTSIVSLDIDDYTSTIVFGAIGGLGYTIKLGNGQTIDIDLRLHMGFSSIIKDDIEIDDEEENITLDGTKIIDPLDLNISLGLSYWFI